MSEEIKRMDLNEFREKGFLQEVNRLFFHPLGLALEVIVEEDGTVAKIGGIWDYRDDPEGMFFSAGMAKLARANAVEELRKSKIQARRNAKYDDIYVGPNGIQLAE
jgi:hypothetical protein